MTRRGVPGHPDFNSERKETLLGLLISCGLILIIFGIILLAIAGLTEFTYQTMTLPPAVRATVDSTRQTSYSLLAVGGGLVVIGLIERL